MRAAPGTKPGAALFILDATDYADRVRVTLTVRPQKVPLSV
jgi:hypothetical protein